MRKQKRYYRLTPAQAWEEFASSPVELFISSFLGEGYIDVSEICKAYTKDIPFIFQRPFSQTHLDQIAILLEQYLEDYLEQIGGLTNLRLYSEEELDEIWQEDVDALLELLK